MDISLSMAAIERYPLIIFIIPGVRVMLAGWYAELRYEKYPMASTSRFIQASYSLS
jgi:hypothetical protein